MRRLILAFTLVAAAASAPLAGQQAQTPAPTPPAQGGSGQSAAAPKAAERTPSLIGPTLGGSNVRLDITITDTFGGKAQKKTVTMTIMSGQTGMVRTQNVLDQRYQVRLNVDAMATAYANGLISTRLTVNYLPGPVADGAAVAAERRDVPGQLEESITVVLTDGKPLILTESADPVSDRKVTLEAKATVLK